MSKRAENLKIVLDTIDTVGGFLETITDKVYEVSTKIESEYEKAVAVSEEDEAAEKRAAETAEVILGLFKNFKSKAPSDLFSQFVDEVKDAPKATHNPTREEKIDHVRQYYRKTFGIAVWPDGAALDDALIDQVYGYLTKNSMTF